MKSRHSKKDSNVEKEEVKKHHRFLTQAERIISWIVALVGLILSIFAMNWSSQVEQWVFAFLVFVNLFVVLILGIVMGYSRHLSTYSKRLLAMEHQKQVNELATRNEELKAMVDQLEKGQKSNEARRSSFEKYVFEQIDIVCRKADEAMHDNIDIFADWADEIRRIRKADSALCSEVLGAWEGDASKRDKETSNANGSEYGDKEDAKADSCHYDRASQMEDSDNLEPRADEFETLTSFIDDSISREADRVMTEFFASHRKFLGQVVETARRCVEAYLRSKGFDLDVSVAVKLFVFPTDTDTLIELSSRRNIFTGFRDERSWNSVRHQSYPMQLYSIGGNTDFLYSIRKGEAYIFNNAVRGSNYENESGSFPEHYNCGATSYIQAKTPRRVGAWRGFGFIACDVKNKDIEMAPIDEQVGNLMNCFAAILGNYYDRTEDAWSMLCAEGDFEFTIQSVEFPYGELEEKMAMDFEGLDTDSLFSYNYYRYINGHREWPGVTASSRQENERD